MHSCPEGLTCPAARTGLQVHMFDGLAMMSKLRVQGGRVWASQRYIQSQQFRWVAWKTCGSQKASSPGRDTSFTHHLSRTPINRCRNYSSTGKLKWREFATPLPANTPMEKVGRATRAQQGGATRNVHYKEHLMHHAFPSSPTHALTPCAPSSQAGQVLENLVALATKAGGFTDNPSVNCIPLQDGSLMACSGARPAGWVGGVGWGCGGGPQPLSGEAQGLCWALAPWACDSTLCIHGCVVTPVSMPPCRDGVFGVPRGPDTAVHPGAGEGRRIYCGEKEQPPWFSRCVQLLNLSPTPSSCAGAPGVGRRGGRHAHRPPQAAARRPHAGQLLAHPAPGRLPRVHPGHRLLEAQADRVHQVRTWSFRTAKQGSQWDQRTFCTKCT